MCDFLVLRCELPLHLGPYRPSTRHKNRWRNKQTFLHGPSIRTGRQDCCRNGEMVGYRSSNLPQFATSSELSDGEKNGLIKMVFLDDSKFLSSAFTFREFSTLKNYYLCKDPWKSLQSMSLPHISCSLSKSVTRSSLNNVSFLRKQPAFR